MRLRHFFTNLHGGLKLIDKTVRAHEAALAEKAKKEGNNKRTQIDRQIKALKTTLEMLHAEVKSAESYFTHISWLQERFPNAEYEDVTKVKRPGVVIGRKGTLGTVHYINSDFWAHDTTLWVKDFKGNHPRFIYYLLKVMHLENYDVGASNPTLNRNHIQLES
jgi:hypothetical protein